MVVAIAAGPVKSVSGPSRETEDFKKSPNSAENWYKLGVAIGQQQRRSDAIGAYREAIRLNRDEADADIWYDFGSLHELSNSRRPLRKLMTVWSNSTQQKLVDVTIDLVHDSRRVI